ncbi:MAG: hypothetical protein D3922_03895 [Candidatus Electrothrix sp. AR1]|nr:hypothetical protein [Candidatus Electrothrix sp. AR1]
MGGVWLVQGRPHVELFIILLCCIREVACTTFCLTFCLILADFFIVGWKFLDDGLDCLLNSYPYAAGVNLTDLPVSFSGKDS